MTRWRERPRQRHGWQGDFMRVHKEVVQREEEEEKKEEKEEKEEEEGDGVVVIVGEIEGPGKRNRRKGVVLEDAVVVFRLLVVKGSENGCGTGRKIVMVLVKGKEQEEE